MNFLRTISLFILLVSSSVALASPLSSSPTSPVVFITQVVDSTAPVSPCSSCISSTSLGGGVYNKVSGTMSGVGTTGNTFGVSTPTTPLPNKLLNLLSGVAMPVLQVQGGAYGQCPGTTPDTLDSGCILASASKWVAANASPTITGPTTFSLAQSLLAWEQAYGYTSAWFSFQQQMPVLPHESVPRILTWSMFVNAQGQAKASSLTQVQATYGAPQLSGTSNSNGTVLYIQYVSSTPATGVSSGWVSPTAGIVNYTLYNNLLTTAAGPTQQSSAPRGAFDQTVAGIGAAVNQGDGYQKLLGNAEVMTAGAYPIGTVPQLLAQTGATIALVDYSYPLNFQYDTVSSGCPNGAASCMRAVIDYTFSYLSVNFCDCGTAQLVEGGWYVPHLDQITDRSIVTVSQTVTQSTTPTVTASVSSQLLQQYELKSLAATPVYFHANSATQAATPLTFDAQGPAGYWWQTIARYQGIALLHDPSSWIIPPLDGAAAVPVANLLTSDSAAPVFPTNGVIALNKPTDPVYLSNTPISGGLDLGIELSCLDPAYPSTSPSTNEFIAGFSNYGVFTAPDTLSTPVPGSTTSSLFATSNSGVTCSGSSYFGNAANSSVLNYYYGGGTECSLLIAAEGAGPLCPNNFSPTTITDNDQSTGTSICLSCPAGEVASAELLQGVPSYTCIGSAGAAATTASPLYEITTACNTSANPGPVTIAPIAGTTTDPTVTPPIPSHWGYSGWQIPSAACGATVTETRTYACYANTDANNNGPAVASSNCDIGELQPLTQSTTVSCPLSPRWVPIPSTCSASPSKNFTTTCEDQYGGTLPDNACATLAKPTGISQQLAADYSGCSYSWQTGTTSCATLGSAAQPITCLRSDGTTVANTSCSSSTTAGPLPAPTTCTFSWSAGGYGSCTGGSSTITKTVSPPNVSCGATVTQTTTYSCLGTANSGTETQSVTCVGSDKSIAANSLCSGTPPPVTTSCTPACTVTVPPNTSTVVTGTPCTPIYTYSWKPGPFGACTVVP